MATSTVARRNMAPLLSGILLFVALVSGQSVQPSNASLPASESIFTQLSVTGGQLLTQSAFNIAPLTAEVGMGGTANAVAAPQFNGNLREIDPSNQNNVTKNDIAYISCDPNIDFSNIDPTSVVKAVGLVPPKGIVLYSTSSQECNLTGDFPSTTIYTMTLAEDSRTLLNSIQLGTNSLQGRVASNATSSSQGSSSTSTTNDGGPAPTTAVAMSILYSITGIITLLFLVIIATGAIRAHRHPERYGPRTGLPGRPRQSRAKGLARAMLETLPIVKFGDPEPVKPGSRDIELEDGTTSVHNTTEAVASPAINANDEHRKEGAVVEVESGLGPAQAESIKSGQEATNKGGELGCSICTEDFTTGEDVRVLPCHHKYHPACIDPWLLNVSGTCPLCRHDLRPVTSSTSDPASPTAEDSELPPPLAANEGSENEAEAVADSDNASSSHSRRRVSRFLDLNRLRHAPPDERIAALRRLREQSQQDGESVEDVEEPSRRARLTGRLRDTFRIRTRTQDQE